MAAPSTVYKDFKTRRRKAGTPDVDVDLFIAKFLQNTTAQTGDNWGDGYFNSTDTEAEKIAKIKGIFKIDGWNQAVYAEQKAGTITISGTSVTGSGTAFTTDFVVGQKVGALLLNDDDDLVCVETYVITAITSDTAMSVVAGTNRSGIAYANYHQGFIGYCNSRTSGNGLYHKTERFSGCGVPSSTQASAEFLNDAGLNVKGTLTINSGITNTESDLSNNGFKITLDFRSSYYNSTTAYGIQWRKQGDTPYNSKTIGTIAAKIKESKTAFSVDVDPTDTLFVEAPFTYEMNAFITNEEGTTLGALNNVTIVPITLSLYYGTTRENAYANGTAVNYYKSRRLDEGATLYDNSLATDPVAAGFYMDKSGTAPYFYYECDADGVVIGIGEYNPSATRVLYEPSGLGSTEANAITDANSTSWVPKYTLYLDNDGYWYANSTGTTLAADGYYVIGDSELSYELIHLIGGLQQF